MRNNLHRLMLIGTGVFALAAAPAMFAGDISRDYSHLRRENADIRADRRQIRKDLEHGRFRAAERERRDLRHDYAERNALRRDIDRDERRRGW